jgi:hypothetical protein
MQGYSQIIQKFIETYLEKIQALSRRLLDLFFEPERREPWLNWTWLGALYVAGILLWGLFLSWGDINFSVNDWSLISGPRLAFLRDAIRSGELPLHISDPATLGGITDRFLAIPDQILSPQVFLLRYLSLGRFVFLDVAILYTIGFLGWLWLRRRFSLSLFAFTILFLLFNFNGHILAHYFIGHATWGGYFLFPWFAVLVINLVNGDRSWVWVAKISLLLLAIFLQGSFHQFVWVLLFLGFLAISNRKNFLPVFGGIVFSVLVSMARILPPMLLLGSFDNQFFAGYLSLSDIWTSLVAALDPHPSIPSPFMTQVVKVWELTFFIGLIGAVFLLYFGLYRWWSKWVRGEQGIILYKELALPVFGTFLLSFDGVYRLVRLLPIPLLEGERVASRIISLPFVFILIFAVIGLQSWLDQTNKEKTLLRLAALGLMVIECHDLWQNFKTWTPVSAAQAVILSPFNSSHWVVANHPDPAYTTAVIVGTVVSSFSIALVLFLALRFHRQSLKTPARLLANPQSSSMKG